MMIYIYNITFFDFLRNKYCDISCSFKNYHEHLLIYFYDKQYVKIIIAAGCDECNQLGENRNNIDKGGDYKVIHPPQKLVFSPLIFEKNGKIIKEVKK